MGYLLETSLAAPIELFLIFTTNTALVLLFYALAGLCRYYYPSQWRYYEQESNSWRCRNASEICHTFLWLFTNAWLVSGKVLRKLYTRLPAAKWKETFRSAKREVEDIYTIFKRYSERAFSNKYRALRLERERVRQNHLREEAVQRKEVEQLRALEEYARDMSAVRIPGEW